MQPGFNSFLRLDYYQDLNKKNEIWMPQELTNHLYPALNVLLCIQKLIFSTRLGMRKDFLAKYLYSQK